MSELCDFMTERSQDISYIELMFGTLDNYEQLISLYKDFLSGDIKLKKFYLKYNRRSEKLNLKCRWSGVESFILEEDLESITAGTEIYYYPVLDISGKVHVAGSADLVVDIEQLKLPEIEI